MTNHKSIARLIGILFLWGIIGNIIGSELLDVIVMSPDYFTDAYPNKTKIIIGILLEMTVAAAVVGIGVLMYQIFKRHNQTIAIAYLGMRIVESSITIPLVLCSLGLLTLSQNYVNGSSLDISNFQLIGTLFQELRTWTLMLYIIFYAYGAVLFYSLLYRAKLLPRFIPLWGLIGLVMAVIGTVYNLFNNNSIPPELYAIPLGLNEIFLGIWLVVRGFKPSVQTSKPTNEVLE